MRRGLNSQQRPGRIHATALENDHMIANVNFYILLAYGAVHGE